MTHPADHTALPSKGDPSGSTSEPVVSGLTLRDLVEIMPDGVLVTDEEHRIVMANEEVLTLFGYTASELIGHSVDILLPERLRAGHVQLRVGYQACPVRRPLKALQPGYLKAQHREGTEFPVEVSLSPIQVGTATYVACTVRDLSERLSLWRKMEEERSSVVAQVFDTIPAMAFALTTDPDVVRPNQLLIDTLGWSGEELMSRGLNSCIPDVRTRVLVRQLIRNPAPGWHDVQLRRRDGVPVESIWSLVRISPTLIAGIGLDVTEKVELEARLRQADKMGAIGQLAGGVAHDFNNLLTVISGRGQMVIRALKGRGLDDAVSDIRQILQSAESATALTRQLLTFSRKESPNVEVVAPSEVALAMEPLLQRLLRADIDFKVRTAGTSTGHVGCARVHIEQILLNLVVNARDAITTSGHITVAVTNLDVGTHADRSLEIPARLSPGAYVCISVSDSGMGMDHDTVSRIFDPFFTTKASGTGLGLATVHDIVEGAGGIINVHSVVRQGTTVTVYLPRVEARKGLETADMPPVPVTSKVGTILVVEDSAGVRRLMVDVLRAKGHTVIDAHDGADALGMIENGIAALDLILTDVVMPKIRGPELVARLRAIHPHVQTLYVSGYARSRSEDLELVPGFTEFLVKPFEPVDLLSKVDALLAVAPGDVSLARKADEST